MSTESVSAPVALVTGADKGIGLETARRLAGAGYRVYLTAPGSERGRAAAATAGAQFLELDVTSDESVHHAVGCVEQAGFTCKRSRSADHQDRRRRSL
jgi:NAD(P)-dependent dehydrogenase (short-subunit alcohol dehydrogenase family)